MYAYVYENLDIQCLRFFVITNVVNYFSRNFLSGDF